ncbi:MAG: hypothetical protein D6826_00925 [Alphaproteobacteria bacterium]|nr:MAG: hypothetical protein D6826_00925 [Alphaproteobacteria bacterium]
MREESLRTGPDDIWPEATRVEEWSDPAIQVALFPDWPSYHPALIARALELEKDPHFTKNYEGAIGSSKVFDLDRWNCPEADLVHARAITLFKRTIGTDKAAVDLSWASLYRHGDYCMPHSHRRALASVVYFLDLGDGPTQGFGAGTFCFADPRLKVCCQDEPGRVTTPCGPTMHPGMMIIFPGQLVHFVDRYLGTRERITLAWNINETPASGPAPR